MKAVLSGDEAIARGAFEAGARFAAAYPGTPSTEILENCARYKEMTSQWSINEKVALEAAGGAAIGGARALCAMKHVGLNVAADPLFTLSYTGINGGLLIVSADDPEMHSSQNEQDNRHYARAAKIPMLEPTDSASALAFTKAGFALSERFDTPVLLRVTTRICHAQGVVDLSDRTDVPLRPYKKDFEKYVMLPVNARRRHPVVEERTLRILAWAQSEEGGAFNRIEPGSGETGFVASGVSAAYVREAFPDAPMLVFGLTYPLDLDLARRFRSMVKTLAVIEEGDPYLEDQLRASGIPVEIGKAQTGLLGELNADRVRNALGLPTEPGLESDVPVPGRPPALCAGCSHRGIFAALKAEGATVFGDIGCYTLAALPPLSHMDTCICMGASVSASTGFVKARAGEERKMACVIGDSTFLHSGMTGLLDAVHNRAPFVTCILDNRVTAMTGHQNNPNTGRNLQGEMTPPLDLKALVTALGVRVVDETDAYDLAGTREVLRRHFALTEPSVVIVKRDCVEWGRIRLTPYAVDPDLCVACQSCVRLGCPAIVFDKAGRRSHILKDACVGCSLCFQVCKFQTIYRTDGEEAHRAATVDLRAERRAKRARSDAASAKKEGEV